MDEKKKKGGIGWVAAERGGWGGGDSPISTIKVTASLLWAWCDSTWPWNGTSGQTAARGGNIRWILHLRDNWFHSDLYRGCNKAGVQDTHDTMMDPVQIRIVNFNHRTRGSQGSVVISLIADPFLFLADAGFFLFFLLLLFISFLSLWSTYASLLSLSTQPPSLTLSLSLPLSPLKANREIALPC